METDLSSQHQGSQIDTEIKNLDTSACDTVDSAPGPRGPEPREKQGVSVPPGKK